MANAKDMSGVPMFPPRLIANLNQVGMYANLMDMTAGTAISETEAMFGKAAGE